ncbi:MAG: DUF1028 domain-containing protein [Planctomycetota bacterium]
MLESHAYLVRLPLLLLVAAAAPAQGVQAPPAQPEPAKAEPAQEQVPPEERPEFAYRATTNEHPYVEIAGLAARDPRTGDLGAIVLSTSPGVGAFCLQAKAGVGVAVVSGNPDPTWPDRALAALAAGASPNDAIAQLKEQTSQSIADRQQLAVLAADGRAASHIGEYVFGVGKTTEAMPEQDWIAFTTYPATTQLMAKLRTEYPATADLPLPERLIMSLQRALDAMPVDAKGKRADLSGQPVSAALLVVRKDGGRLGLDDRMIDIRVDFDLDPVARLRGIYKVWCQAHLAPALRQSIGSIIDTQSDAYKANQEWLRRLRSRTKIGEKR